MSFEAYSQADSQPKYGVDSQDSQWRFSDVSRVVSISDVHGAYDDMVLTLQSAKVISDQLEWVGGSTHLVLTGDMVDRGPESRSVMDLMIRMESAAQRAGGRVHVLLGNHEVMNLVGDLRYVSTAEFAAFSGEEVADERQRWQQHFLALPEAQSKRAVTRFDEMAPPGFFGHRRAFASDGYYGKWLLDKPLMIVINNTAYVHGGVPPLVAKLGLHGVNQDLKTDLIEFLNIRSQLESSGAMSPIDGFRNFPSVLSARLTDGLRGKHWAENLQQLTALKASPLHGANGPMWYRGSSLCSALVEGDSLSHALTTIDATRVVVGHTTTESHQVQQRLGGRVIEINTGMLKSSYGGSGYALIIEDNEVSVVSQDGETKIRPLTPPRRVGYESALIDDRHIATVLESGNIVQRDKENGASRLVRVTAGKLGLTARFSPTSKNTEFMPELAAYRLDQALGLEMIPVTVRRELGGQVGTLQFVSETAISERKRIANNMGERAGCELNKQRRTVQLFDALIGNPNRPQRSLMFSPENGRFLLADHQGAFTLQTSLNRTQKNLLLPVGDYWREALQNLGDEQLRNLLGDVLDEGRLKVLFGRRDALIQLHK